jgi:putative serine protease PepD
MRRLNAFLAIVGGAVAGGLIALAVTGGHSTTHSSTTTTVVRSAGVPTALSTGGKGMTVNQIYRSASPGVVDITVTETSGGGLLQQSSKGEGAGVVYDSSGDILTDEHVVSGASSVKVAFQDGRTATARVLGTDPSTDVAVIRVDVPASELHPIALADSSQAQVGDPVVAIGSPFSLPETTTTGIVSQVGRSIVAPNNYQITGAVQTDAAINPGNSGGPLLDANGHVLGLNDQIQTNSGQSAGVGFAVPSNTVARIAKAIIGGHPIKHAYVGVSLAPAGPAQVGRIEPGSPAQSSGIRDGDVVTAINGKPVTTTEQFIATIDGYSPGDKVTLTIKRGGQQQNVKMTLGTRPASTPTGG